MDGSSRYRYFRNSETLRTSKQKNISYGELNKIFFYTVLWVTVIWRGALLCVVKSIIIITFFFFKYKKEMRECTEAQNTPLSEWK